jgi:D,D-heptose 1,7-bisphosphate phosphatase
MGMGKKAVFLDRDGTINEDPGYLSDPSQLKLFEGVPESLGRLKSAGFLLVVVSNQSGVGRGLIQPDVLPKIHEKLNSMLKAQFGVIDEFQLCLHHPDKNCDCRKPKTKLFLDAKHSLGIDISSSYMIGDKVSDIVAGKAAGCKGSILVRTGHGSQSEQMLKSEKIKPDVVTNNLMDAAHWILSRK